MKTDLQAWLGKHSALDGSVPEGGEQKQKYCRVVQGKTRATATEIGRVEDIVGGDPAKLAADVLQIVNDTSDALPCWAQVVYVGRKAPAATLSLDSDEEIEAPPSSPFGVDLMSNPNELFAVAINAIVQSNGQLIHANQGLQGILSQERSARDRFALDSLRLINEARDARLIAEIQNARLDEQIKAQDGEWGGAVEWISPILEDVGPGLALALAGAFRGKRDKETPDQMADRLMGETILLAAAHPEMFASEKRVETISKLLDKQDAAKLQSIGEGLSVLLIMVQQKFQEKSAAAEPPPAAEPAA